MNTRDTNPSAAKEHKERKGFWTAVASAARHRFGRERSDGATQPFRKAPSPLRSAGALQILSGSLPRGVPVTAYGQLIRLAHRFSVRTLLSLAAIHTSTASTILCSAADKRGFNLLRH
jgi:hypothetical protein